MVRMLKDKSGRLLSREEGVRRRWKDYFEGLMNEEYEREKRRDEGEKVNQHVQKITESEVREAMKRMKQGKADNVQTEVWKVLGEIGMNFLIRLFDKILQGKKSAGTNL